MTGRPQYNYEAFMVAKANLEADGWEVVTPFECNSRVWQRWHGRDFDPFEDRCDWGDPLLAQMFAEDLQEMLVHCNAIYLLPDWAGSTGASVELLLAWMFDKEILGELGTWPRKLVYQLGRALSAALYRILDRKERHG